MNTSNYTKKQIREILFQLLSEIAFIFMVFLFTKSIESLFLCISLWVLHHHDYFLLILYNYYIKKI